MSRTRGAVAQGRVATGQKRGPIIEAEKREQYTGKKCAGLRNPLDEWDCGCLLQTLRSIQGAKEEKRAHRGDITRKRLW